VKKRTLGIVCLTTLMVMTIFLQACGAEAAMEFETVSLDILPAAVAVNESTTVRGEVRNGSVETARYNVPLMVNGVAENRKSISLAPGASETVEFSLARSEPGSYEIAIGQRTAIVLVKAVIPASFEVSDLTVNPAQANPLEEVVITATVTNAGGAQGTYVAELKINGVTEKTDKLTMAPGIGCNLAFRISRNTPGTYTVTLGDLTGEFIVQEPVRPIQIDNPTCPPARPGSQRPKCCG